MPYGDYKLRRRAELRARASTEHGVVPDVLPSVRAIEERGLVLRENALHDDQSGAPLIGWAVIGTMTTGEPEA